jgi:hypothetical protein
MYPPESRLCFPIFSTSVLDRSNIRVPRQTCAYQWSPYLALSAATSSQYLGALFTRSFLPQKIMRKKADDAARPTNAALIKQF